MDNTSHTGKYSLRPPNLREQIVYDDENPDGSGHTRPALSQIVTDSTKTGSHNRPNLPPCPLGAPIPAQDPIVKAVIRSASNTDDPFWCLTAGMTSIMGDDEYILSFWARRADKAGTGILDDGEAFVGAWFAPCNNDPKIFKMPEDGKWRFYSVAIHKTQNLEDLPVFMGGHKVLIDDIRLVTRDARVTTYTHEPHVGVTSIIDENNQTVFYEYDDFGRLRAAFDTDGNLLQANQYQLSQP